MFWMSAVRVFARLVGSSSNSSSDGGALGDAKVPFTREILLWSVVFASLTIALGRKR